MVAGELSSYYRGERVKSLRLASSHSILTLKLTLTILIYCLSRSSPQAFGPRILSFLPALALRTKRSSELKTSTLGGFLHRTHVTSESSTTLLLTSLSHTVVSQIPPAARLSNHELALETRILNRKRDGWAVMTISLRLSFLHPSLAERRKRMSVLLACSIRMHGHSSAGQ